MKVIDRVKNIRIEETIGFFYWLYEQEKKWRKRKKWRILWKYYTKIHNNNGEQKKSNKIKMTAEKGKDERTNKEQPCWMSAPYPPTLLLYYLETLFILVYWYRSYFRICPFHFFLFLVNFSFLCCYWFLILFPCLIFLYYTSFSQPSIF